ncbi:hypothetical protein HK103_002551 [Boothiomyces macroporosus]|uniref:3-carboxymuconate cyclase n=1 Tax=Boothiomyces macroporosus TaxID=261099 RepID=A0AAD5U999_9FUNG|nr:hypothetical protein HK103_002551 [Boothiomyces macroporosus]
MFFLLSLVSAAAINNIQGATYLMTNDPAGNNIVVSAIGQDGKLSIVNTVSTGGKGGNGIADKSDKGPDSLFSQDSVIVGGNFLFNVNPGSNSVSMFSIDQADPTRIKLLQTADSCGDFPVALAFSSKLQMLCVVNGGANNSVMCYSVGANGLQGLPDTTRPLGFKQTTPPNGPLGTVSDVLFNDDSSQVLVSVKGNPPANFTGFIASFAVQGNALADKPVLNEPKGSVAPFSMSLVPNTNNRVLFTDAGVGFGLLDLQQGTESASAVVPVQGQGAICWSDFSPRTKNMYMVDIKTSLLTEVNVATSGSPNATLVAQHPLSGNTIDFRIASLKDKDVAFVNTPGNNAVQVVSLDAPGKTTLLQTLDLACVQGASSRNQGMAFALKNGKQNQKGKKGKKQHKKKGKGKKGKKGKSQEI